MKKIILCLVLSWMSLMVLGQENFEGVVTHNMITANKNDSAVLDVFYGKNKIRANIRRLKGEVRDSDEEIIIDFSNGLFYKINIKENTYSVDSIINKKSYLINSKDKMKSGDKQRILSYLSTPVIFYDKIDISENINPIITIWYADSINYFVDKKHLLTDEILALTNGNNIGLGMSITITKQNEEIDSIIGKLLPIYIEKKVIPDYIFEIKSDLIVEVKESRFNDINLDVPKMEEIKSKYPSSPRINNQRKSNKKSRLKTKK